MAFSRTRIAVLFFLTLILAVGLWCAYGLWAVAGVETPHYSVSQVEADYEVRSYEPMILATVTVEGNLENASTEGFLRLYHYIEGGNVLGQSIAMSAPVSTEQVRDSENPSYAVSFVMPAESSMDVLPLPSDPSLRIVSLPERRVAVLTFYGKVEEENILAKMQAFSEELNQDGYSVRGEMSVAQYQPPFVPWFLRRNEIWAEVLDIR